MTAVRARQNNGKKDALRNLSHEKEFTVPDLAAQTTSEWVSSLHDWLAGRFPGEMTAVVLVIGGTLLCALLVHLIVKTVILNVIGRVVRRTPTQWDDFLIKRGFFTRIVHLAPAVIIYLSAPLYTPPFFEWDLRIAIQRIAFGYMIVVGVLIVNAALNSIADIYGTLEIARRNPIKGFIQGAKILVWIVGGIFLVAKLTGQEPWGVVAGIGAITAVLLLVFKDTILGLVASVQIFVNNMVLIGDWIEMPKYGADGAVIDITLTTVKVQNWDNTITTIPTYALISDSFKNWRGMQESGGRRIKRSIQIDMNTVKFCTDEMLERFGQFKLLTDYIQNKLKEVNDYNTDRQIDPSQVIDGRRLTNVGTFRAYVKAYLADHPKIHPKMTFLVRQLAPTDRGLPIEVYVFSSDTAWVSYEEMQADIFDHILAVLPEFDLAVFQNPTGNDFRGIAKAA